MSTALGSCTTAADFGKVGVAVDSGKSPFENPEVVSITGQAIEKIRGPIDHDPAATNRPGR